MIVGAYLGKLGCGLGLSGPGLAQPGLEFFSAQGHQGRALLDFAAGGNIDAAHPARYLGGKPTSLFDVSMACYLVGRARRVREGLPFAQTTDDAIKPRRPTRLSDSDQIFPEKLLKKAL